MKIRNFGVLAALLFASLNAAAQSFDKLADDTIKYIKAGTFGKPNVAKKTTKIALTQVRVHYKTVTSQSNVQKNNAADVTVYLDGDLTTSDLQELTDEFHLTLAANLRKLGIEMVGYEAVKTTEYYAEKLGSQEKEKGADFDGKLGQAWVTISAYDGPVFFRWRPYGAPEIVGYGQWKKLSKTAETVGADLMMVDVIVDFAAIMLRTDIRQDRAGWLYSDPYFHSDYSIAALISVPHSNIFMINRDNGSDTYQSALPVAERYNFSDKLREDPSRAAYNTQKYFNGARHSFTPLVVPAKRELYKAAARQVLNRYAEVLTEKFRVIRSGEKPGDNKNVAQSKPTDNTTIEQVREKARVENDTTPITTSELTAAIVQAKKEGKFKLAIDYYGELIKNDPEEVAYYVERGALYMNALKDYKSAIKDFDQTLKLKPGMGEALYNRGSAHLQLQDFKKAKKDLDTVVQIAPNFAEAWLNRGIANLNLKATDAALADFNRGIEINPRLPNLYRARAIAYKILGNAALAQADELRAVQMER